MNALVREIKRLMPALEAANAGRLIGKDTTTLDKLRKLLTEI